MIFLQEKGQGNLVAPEQLDSHFPHPVGLGAQRWLKCHSIQRGCVTACLTLAEQGSEGQCCVLAF